MQNKPFLKHFYNRAFDLLKIISSCISALLRLIMYLLHIANLHALLISNYINYLSITSHLN